MKRILALVLCLAMTLAVFASCTTLEDEDKGAVIDVYLTNEIYNFDPAFGFTDASTAKILSLIFQGLTKLDSDGNWQKALMKNYEVVQDDEDGFKIQITLKDTKWSDSRVVQANDIVYAWKRILDPDFKCEAAAMLYDIKNASKVKMGDASIDDLGVVAVDTLILEIEFEHKVDLDGFFRTVASPALVALREDIVSVNENWAKKASSMVTNGPFDIKELDYGETLRLERNSYYFRDTEENDILDKYVIPYRIITHYDIGTTEDQLDAFLSGDIHYLGEIPLESRQEYASYANATDIAVTHTYLFNQSNKLFANADVRRALSMAIDRQHVAELVTYAKPATGFIPYGVFDANGKNSFREVADKEGALVNTSADFEGAKSLLKSAGVTSGAFTITIRDDEVDLAVASYVKSVWEELGFTVKIRPLVYSTDATDSTVISDDFCTAYQTGNFDVIAYDAQMLTSDAYCALAPFATTLSGNGVNMSSPTYDVRGHVSGYSNTEYDAIFDSYLASADGSERTQYLHQAEKMLLEDAVIMPVFFEQDAFLYSNILSDLNDTYFGKDFNSMKMKNYMAYKEDASANGDAYLNDVRE